MVQPCVFFFGQDDCLETSAYFHLASIEAKMPCHMCIFSLLWFTSTTMRESRERGDLDVLGIQIHEYVTFQRARY